MPHAEPLLFVPVMERPEPDEHETAAALLETMRGISETTAKDYGHAVRSVHAKSHGLLRGTLTVLEDLPRELAQGMFAESRAYPVVMRFSTVPGDILDDAVSTPRGLSVKAVGVAGERLPGSEGDLTQDFVLVNAPAFAAPNAKAFLGNLKLLAATTDRSQTAKKAISAALRGVEKAVEALGGESPTLKTMGGHPLSHVLAETYYSQVPLLYGDHVAKISVVPVSPALKALIGREVEVAGRPNALREETVAFFREQGGEWEVRAQLCTNLERMPIEDASVIWPEEESPYRLVARIHVPPQTAWSEARSAAIDDGLAFSPWHGLAAHRPLGSIMRSRKAAYEMSAEFRARHNGRVIAEPRNLDFLPD